MTKTKKKTGGMILVAIAVMAMSASAAETSFRWVNMSVSNLLNSAGSAFNIGDATILNYASDDTTINFDPSVLLSNTYGDDDYYGAIGNLLLGRLATDFHTMPSSSYVGDYAYAVILDVPYATFTNSATGYGGNVANVPTGTWYTVMTGANGFAFDALANTEGGASLPQTFNPTGTLQTSTQVVPEPATALLFGLGGLGAWVIRRNKRNAEEKEEA